MTTDSTLFDPSLAASLANAVYGIRETTNVERGLVARKEDALLDSKEFDFSRATVIAGNSGAGVRATSGFGLVVPGAGKRQGEYVVATRGTVTGYDWLSNFTAALEGGPGGHLVHAGFNRVSKSIMADVMGSLRNKNPSQIHCVGHSLGGAIANIVACQLNQVGGAALYTFGAPRAGTDTFCEALGASLGTERICRAFNMSDVVPMVPIYPFWHAPMKLPGALVGPSHGIVIPQSHFMTAYGPAVAGKSWHSLQLRAQDTPLSTEQLLERAAQEVRIPGLSTALHLLGRTLGALLAASDRVIGSRVTLGVTVMDRMAMMLSGGRAESAETDDQLKRFMGYVLSYAGVPLQVGVAINFAFINYVLGLLLRPLVGSAQTALAQGQDGGR